MSKIAEICKAEEETPLPILLYEMGFITQEQLLACMKLQSDSDETHEIGCTVKT